MPRGSDGGGGGGGGPLGEGDFPRASDVSCSARECACLDAAWALALWRGGVLAPFAGTATSEGNLQGDLAGRCSGVGCLGLGVGLGDW
jgi:hypothetical protein